MALTEQQADAIKEQLLKQLDHFPENERELVKKKILSMNVQEVEVFVKQNQLSHLENKNQDSTSNCIFCNIVSGNVPSTKIYEDKENIVILEINPLSKGHSMVVPKKHLKTTEISESSFNIAKKVAKKISETLKPQETKINIQNIMNHALIEILPLYGDEKERKKADEKELKELQKVLFIENEKPKKQPEKIPDSKLPKLKRRLP